MELMYAQLFDSQTGEKFTNCERTNLVCGPETERRRQQNTDNCAVTVCCITYKHEEYIRQALDSFLMQKTNFKFKVFVGEDCGPDGTADIIREYAQRYPDIIVPFIRETNMGAQRNLIDLCTRACSPYIAFCEGDDYWIDAYKLQKQFDYMQAHTNIRMCYTHTEILAPEDWHLNSWYIHDPDGKMVIPRCTPGFTMKDYFTVQDFTTIFPNHTSSAFYRWDYDLVFPEWFFQGLIGDTPCTMLQMGLGKAVYLPDVTSVYRRSDVGVFMNKSNDDHFLKTRLDYIRLLSGVREYFSEHYDHAYGGVLRWRITKEIANYLQSVKNAQNTEMVTHLFEKYPQEAFDAMQSFLGCYGIYEQVKRKIGKKNEFLLLETRRGIYSALPGLCVYGVLHKTKLFLAGLKRKAAKLRDCICYWTNSLKPKQKNLWVFSGFFKKNYMDNTMYLYENVLEHHPEIQAVWVTESNEIYNRLTSEKKPVLKMSSKEGRDAVARAEIAVTDHFKVTDYSPRFGFNDQTKVVQLWHGVGFKSMGDGRTVHNTKEKGVRYSFDILPQETDSPWVRFVKRLKYFFYAPFRELFEKYFLFVCPGQERVDMIGKIWNIPEDRYFMAGHPRNAPMYRAEVQTNPKKVIYAPTYRFDYRHESAMVDDFLNQLDAIQALMEQIDGEFYLRLHPHTWRNYNTKIENALSRYDRVFQDDTKDIYQSLGTYSILISDYSSIAMDFAMLDRPVIFLGADYDWFMENEAGFNIDFKNAIPGPLVASWPEALEQVQLYHENPEKDQAYRREKCRYFFDPAANGPDNSERIVQEIKRRIELN